MTNMVILHMEHYMYTIYNFTMIPGPGPGRPRAAGSSGRGGPPPWPVDKYTSDYVCFGHPLDKYVLRYLIIRRPLDQIRQSYRPRTGPMRPPFPFSYSLIEPLEPDPLKAVLHSWALGIWNQADARHDALGS